MASPPSFTFHWADYLVFALSLVASLAIGVYFAISANKTTKDFLMASRQGKVFPVAMSMLASFSSAIFIVGFPAEIYYFGTTFSIVGIGYILFLAFGAQVFVPLYHRMDVTSAYEYLEKRFNFKIRIIGSLIFIVLMGGLKAVIWTDTLQMMIVFGGLIALIILGSINVGGMTEVWNTATERGRIIFDEISPDPRVRHTWWTMTIGTFFQFISLVGANQTVIQRYLAVEKKRDAQIAVYVVLIGALFSLILVVLLGLVMVKYYESCDPIVAGHVTSADQIVPLFMMEVMGHLHGLPGLFTASVFSAALSTVSSAINSLAAVVLEDFIRPAFRTFKQIELSDRACNWTSKGLAFFFGALTVGLSYVAPHMGPVLVRIALSIFGTAGGPLMGLFALGIFFPFVNSIGAAVGVLVSIVITYWINVGSILYIPGAKPELPIGLCLSPDNMTVFENTSVGLTSSTYMTTGNEIFTTEFATLAPAPDEPAIYELYKVSYMWYGFISITTAIITGILVSALTGFRKGMKPIPRELLAFDCGFAEEKQEKDIKMEVNGTSTAGHANLGFTEGEKYVIFSERL